MRPQTIVSTITRIACLAFLMPVGILMAQNPDSTAVSEQMEQVKSHAARAEDEAGTLESYTRSDLHWRTHATQLTIIKEHVNNLIEDANQLKAMRDQGSPWQQEAIDRISALLPEMASQLTATINHFNDNTDRLKQQPYRDYALATRDMIAGAHRVIADLVDYGKSKAKAEALEKKLELRPSAETGQVTR